MKRSCILILAFVFSFSHSHAQQKSHTLNNGVKVTFTGEKTKKDTYTVKFTNNQYYYIHSFKTTLLDVVLEDYAKKKSNSRNELSYAYSGITLQTIDSETAATVFLVDVLRGFHYNDLAHVNQQSALLREGLEVPTNSYLEKIYRVIFPDGNNPFLEHNTRVSPTNLSTFYNNGFALDNIEIFISGNSSKKKLKAFENAFEWRGDDIRPNHEVKNISFTPASKGAIHNINDGKTNQTIFLVLYTKSDAVDKVLKKLSNLSQKSEKTTKNIGVDYSEIILQKDNVAPSDIASYITSCRNSIEVISDDLLTPTAYDIVMFGDPKNVYPIYKRNVLYYNDGVEHLTSPYADKNFGSLTPKQVINNYLKFVIPESTLKGLKNMRVQYELQLDNNPTALRIEMLKVLPYSYANVITLDDKEISREVFNGKEGWTNKDGKIINFTPEQTRDALLEQILFPERDYPSHMITEEGIIEQTDGSYLYKVRVNMNDHIIYEYFNPSFLLVKKEICKVEYQPIKTIIYEKWNDFGDIYYPSEIKTMTKEKTIYLTTKHYRINAPVFNEEFEKINFSEQMYRDDAISKSEGAKYQLVAKEVSTAASAKKITQGLIERGFVNAHYAKDDSTNKIYVLYDVYYFKGEAKKQLQVIRKAGLDVYLREEQSTSN